MKDENKETLPLTMVSYNRTQSQCYMGSGDYGTVQICPGVNVTLITKSQEVVVLLLHQRIEDLLFN